MDGRAAGATPTEVADWVMQLRPSESTATDDRRAVYADDAEVLDQFGENAWLWIRELGEAVIAKIATTHPGYRDGGLPSATLRHAVHGGLLRLLLAIGTGRRLGMMTVETQLASQEFVRRGIPLATIVAGIRAGTSYILDAVLEQIDQHFAMPERPKEMRRVVPLVLATFDDFITEVQNSYLQEHARWAMGIGAARRELVQQIMDQQEVDPERASDMLDYPLDGEHTALVVAAGDDDSGHDVHASATTLLRELGADRQLLLPAGQELIWAWGANITNDLTRRAAERTADMMRVAIGKTYGGVSGFRISHLQAVEAFRIADQAGRKGVTLYHDVQLAALLTVDGELAGRFVQDELGALADNTRENEELRDTVWAYLEANGSFRHAGEKLYINRNTVAYRIAKAERLLGRSIKDRRQELLAALSILRTSPDATLHRDP